MNRWHWSVVAAALALAPAARADDSSTLKDEKEHAEQKAGKAWDKTKEEARETGSAAEQEMTQAKEEAEGTGSASTATAGGEAKQQLTKTERKVLQKLHASSQMEIGMARIAKDNAQNEKVKELAEKIQEDHQELADDVSELARERNVDLPMHAKMEKNRKHVEQMQKMTGARFDQHYAQMMAQEHQKEIAELRRSQASIRDEDVKKILDDALPKLEEHQKLAMEAQREVGGERQGRRAMMKGARDTRTGSATSTGASGNTAADANTSSTGATSEDATTWGNDSSKEQQPRGEQPKATGSDETQAETGNK